jgi:TrmH family RNA methyltransferase
LAEGESHVVLVNPSDPGNLGTICRAMLGFGFTNLGVIKPASDIFDPKTIRASMGAVFQMNFQYFPSFEEYRKNFKRNIYVFMTDGVKKLGELAFQKSYALVFGNEGAGLGQEFKKFGESVKIPQSDKVDSLNLAVAVGVSLYEAMKSGK